MTVAVERHPNQPTCQVIVPGRRGHDPALQSGLQQNKIAPPENGRGKDFIRRNVPGTCKNDYLRSAHTSLAPGTAGLDTGNAGGTGGLGDSLGDGGADTGIESLGDDVLLVQLIVGDQVGQS